MQAKLIFNPASGNPGESAAQLLELLRQLQAVNIQAEILLVEPEMRLGERARSAARAGTKMVIVSGGDGTIENVALGLVGTRTALGIIPTGTRNNLARSLGIPTNDIAAAVGLAVALHLIEDRMWEQPDILLWPLLGGFHFHKAVSINEYILDLLQGLHPSLSISFVSEVAGFLILLAYFAVEVRKHLRGS